MSKNTKFKIWYVHQIGAPKFEREVPDAGTGMFVLDTIYLLALFQYANKMIPDYANAGGVVYFDEDEQSWIDYEEEEV